MKHLREKNIVSTFPTKLFRAKCCQSFITPPNKLHNPDKINITIRKYSCKSNSKFQNYRFQEGLGILRRMESAISNNKYCSKF